VEASPVHIRVGISSKTHSTCPGWAGHWGGRHTEWLPDRRGAPADTRVRRPSYASGPAAHSALFQI